MTNDMRHKILHVGTIFFLLIMYVSTFVDISTIFAGAGTAQIISESKIYSSGNIIITPPNTPIDLRSYIIDTGGANYSENTGSPALGCLYYLPLWIQLEQKGDFVTLKGPISIAVNRKQGSIDKWEQYNIPEGKNLTITNEETHIISESTLIRPLTTVTTTNRVYAVCEFIKNRTDIDRCINLGVTDIIRGISKCPTLPYYPLTVIKENIDYAHSNGLKFGGGVSAYHIMKSDCVDEAQYQRVSIPENLGLLNLKLQESRDILMSWVEQQVKLGVDSMFFDELFNTPEGSNFIYSAQDKQKIWDELYNKTKQLNPNIEVITQFSYWLSFPFVQYPADLQFISGDLTIELTKTANELAQSWIAEPTYTSRFYFIDWPPGISTYNTLSLNEKEKLLIKMNTVCSLSGIHFAYPIESWMNKQDAITEGTYTLIESLIASKK